MGRPVGVLGLCLWLLQSAPAPAAPAWADHLAPVGNIAVERTSYAGRDAVKVRDLGPPDGQTEKLVRLDGAAFRDGEIDLWVAGEPGPGANPGARGFVGVMFRLSPDSKSGEGVYLRPTNGRSDDQERRNHSVQYFSAPDWPWERTRRETPGRYETYVDLEPRRWAHMRLVVDGARARLFVDGATQPTLIVNDLKGGAERRGGVGLWIGPGTIAYFADVQVRSK